MHSLEWLTLSCPYCGEQLDVSVDCSIEYQQYVEDCQVCCRPMLLTAIVDEHDGVKVSAAHEDA